MYFLAVFFFVVFIGTFALGIKVFADSPAYLWLIVAGLVSLILSLIFLFIDKVNESDGEKFISTTKYYDEKLKVVAAHKKVGGLIPGNILCEQSAQSALVLGLARGLIDLKRHQVVLARQKADLIHPAQAPCEI